MTINTKSYNENLDYIEQKFKEYDERLKSMDEPKSIDFKLDNSPRWLTEDELLEKVWNKLVIKLYNEVREDIVEICDKHYQDYGSKFSEMKDEINDFIQSKKLYENKLAEVENIVHQHSIGVENVYIACKEYAKDVDDLKSLLNSNKVDNIYKQFNAINKLMKSDEFLRNVNILNDSFQNISSINDYLEDLVSSIKGIVEYTRD